MNTKGNIPSNCSETMTGMTGKRELLLGPDTVFLASKKETGNEWELFKENVRPLKRGRKVGLLNHALKSHADPISRISLLQQRRKLIEAIDEYQGDDPLQRWIQTSKCNEPQGCSTFHTI